MPTCPHCRRDVEPASSVCPHCRAEIPREAESTWINVARLNNLAEAGYFAELLDEAGIGVNVHHRDQFNAVDGAWSTSYFIQVDRQDAERAAELVRAEIERDPPEESDSAGEDDFEPAPVFWRPLALMIFAGGLAYWAGQGMTDAERTHGPRSLLGTLRRIETPLESPLGEGGPRFRLQYDRMRDVIYLDEDFDGDGRYDVRRIFRDGAPVEEAGRLAN